MSRKREAIFMGIGIMAGLTLSGPAVQAADYLTARPSTQAFYINGQQASLTAYLIGGSNYVRLRDIGKAVDFDVTYDAATNSVVGHAEIYRPADVPESDVVAPADEVGGERCLLAVDVECLGAGSDSEIICRLGGWATQCEPGQHPEPHKNRFSFSASHNVVSLRY